MKRYNIYSIYFTGTSKKQFENLAKKIQKEVIKILEDEIAHNPLIGKPLQGPLKGLHSQRIGNLRIIYQVIEEQLQIMVINIGHKKSVYQISKAKKK